MILSAAYATSVAAVLIAGPTLAPTNTAAEKIAATAARRFVWMVADVILSSFGFVCSSENLFPDMPKVLPCRDRGRDSRGK